MVSTLRVSSGGGWAGPVGDGNLRVKWGGPWISPAYVYHKMGDLGGGYWRDTGYRGYPNPPQSIWVHAWDFNNVALGFTGPAAGGAPTVAYNLVQTDSAGNWLNQVEVGGSPWGNFGVGQDGYYQFYVRSKSAAGLYSGFTGPVRVKIGHTETGYWQTEGRTEGWTSETASGYRNKDDPFWVGIPPSVILTSMHWRNLQMPGSSVVTPGTNREVNWVFAGQDYGTIRAQLGTVYKGNNTDWAFNNWGDWNPWGIVARGAGWSTTGNTNVMLYTDGLWCHGTHHYNVDVYYVTRYHEGNSYW
jgi:hypothetical protein